MIYLIIKLYYFYTFKIKQIIIVYFTQQQIMKEKKKFEVCDKTHYYNYELTYIYHEVSVITCKYI